MRMPTVHGYVTTMLVAALGLALFGRRDLAGALVVAIISAKVTAVMAQFDLSREGNEEGR